MVALALVLAHALVAPAKADELTDAINVERARHGLCALAFDPSLSEWAKCNNAAQAGTGRLGHHVYGPYGQIALQVIVGAPVTIAQAVGEWMQSPSHRALILRADMRFGGGCQSACGKWWTYNLNYFPVQPPKTIESKPAADGVPKGQPVAQAPTAAACSIEAKPATKTNSEPLRRDLEVLPQACQTIASPCQGMTPSGNWMPSQCRVGRRRLFWRWCR